MTPLLFQESWPFTLVLLCSCSTGKIKLSLSLTQLTYRTSTARHLEENKQAERACGWSTPSLLFFVRWFVYLMAPGHWSSSIYVHVHLYALVRYIKAKSFIITSCFGIERATRLDQFHHQAAIVIAIAIRVRLISAVPSNSNYLQSTIYMHHTDRLMAMHNWSLTHQQQGITLRYVINPRAPLLHGHHQCHF